MLDARYGLHQGFDVYDDRLSSTSRAESGGAFRFAERRAPDTLRPAAAWIAQQPGRWFAWVHLFDPHAPYAAPATLANRGYDGEVAYVDASIGSFLAGLGAAVQQTLVIVTADHGESLGEHGESTHGLFAYDATLRVPLIVAGPGVQARVAPEAVSHVDIMPTVLELTGTHAAGAGQSLVHALKASHWPLDRSTSRRWTPRSRVGGRRSAASSTTGGSTFDLPLPELYDLDADAAEGANRPSVVCGRGSESENAVSES